MRYVYTREYLEEQADKINMKYYPERLKEVIPLDPYDLLERLGLDVEWKYISPNDSILGMIFFEDGYWYVWPSGKYKKGDIPKYEFFKKGTVVINQILLDKKSNAKKEVFVCNHENMHWIKDKDFFKTKDASPLHICNEDAMNKTYWNNTMSDVDIIERQNNYLNAAVLMPRNVIKREFFKRLRFKTIPSEPIKYEVYMKKHIKSLADDYGLNFSPILFRLYDLGILKRENK